MKNTINFNGYEFLFDYLYLAFFGKHVINQFAQQFG